jgi:hypothetical protein
MNNPIPTKEWLKEQAEADAENNLDTLLWYMQEYREYFNYSEVAKIFSDAYTKLAEKVAREMEENEDEEF